MNNMTALDRVTMLRKIITREPLGEGYKIITSYSILGWTFYRKEKYVENRVPYDSDF
jgi:hypothetical protein